VNKVLVVVDTGDMVTGGDHAATGASNLTYRKALSKIVYHGEEGVWWEMMNDER
jgi:hypothetical protein